jgi:hypothetical protein
MRAFYQQPGLGDPCSFGQILFSLRVDLHASKVDGNRTLNGITQGFRGRLHRTLQRRVYLSEWGSQERWKSFLRATLCGFTGGAPDQPVSYNGFTIRVICRSDKQLANVRYRTLSRQRTVRIHWTSEAAPRHRLQRLFAHFLQSLKVAHHNCFTPRAHNPLPFPFREQAADGEEGGAG